MATTFELFLSQLSETNATLDYFVDFEKVRSNVHSIELKLNQLNYLIGRDNLAESVREIYDENAKAFDVLDILIAVRGNKTAKTISHDGEVVSVKSIFLLRS